MGARSCQSTFLTGVLWIRFDFAVLPARFKPSRKNGYSDQVATHLKIKICQHISDVFVKAQHWRVTWILRLDVHTEIPQSKKSTTRSTSGSKFVRSDNLLRYMHQAKELCSQIQFCVAEKVLNDAFQQRIGGCYLWIRGHAKTQKETHIDGKDADF